MAEHYPSPEQEPAYEYPDTRTEALHLIAAHGWARQTEGAVNAPTGQFAHISNDAADIMTIQDAFGDLLDQLQVTVADVTGHFIVVVKDDEQVRAHEFPTDADAGRAFIKQQAAFLRWSAGLPS